MGLKGRAMKIGFRWGIGAAVVVIAAALTGLPIMTGSMAESAYRSGVEEIRQAEIVEYERGFYSSSVLTRYRFENGGMAFDVVQNVSHGMTGARFDGNVIPLGEMREVMAQLGGDENTIRFNGRYGFNDIQFTLTTEPLVGTLDLDQDAQLELGRLRVAGNSTNDGETVFAEIHWDGAALRSLSGPDVVEVGDFSGQMAVSLVAGTTAMGVWEGEFGAGVNHFLMDVEGTDPLEVGSVRLAGRTEVEPGDQLANELKFDFEALQTADLRPLNGRATLQTRGLLIEPLLELARQAEQFGDNAPYERLLADAIEQGVTVRLSETEISAGPERRLMADAELEIQPEMAGLLRAGLVAFGGIEAMALELNVALDQQLADELPRDLGVWLAQLRAFGLLRPQDGQLKLKLELNDGQILVNGQPWG